MSTSHDPENYLVWTATCLVGFTNLTEGRPLNNLPSAFWSGESGFLLDRTHHYLGASTGLCKFGEQNISELLEASGRLPDLGKAPVASWLLPRLAELTSGGIELDDGDRIWNDGGGVYLNWVAFTKEFKPLAFFMVRCYANRILMGGQCMRGTDPAELVSAFVAVLLKKPAAIRKLAVSVTDTDPPMAPGTRGRTYRFGWNGSEFVGTREYE